MQTKENETEKKPEAEEKKKMKRRTFMKKALYAAPAITALGQLAKPTSAHADPSTVDPRPWQ